MTISVVSDKILRRKAFFSFFKNFHLSENMCKTVAFKLQLFKQSFKSLEVQ